MGVQRNVALSPRNVIEDLERLNGGRRRRRRIGVRFGISRTECVVCERSVIVGIGREESVTSCRCIGGSNRDLERLVDDSADRAL